MRTNWLYQKHWKQPDNPEDGTPDANDSEEPTDPTPVNNERYLILFTLRSVNTEHVAHEIRDQLDYDILEVESEAIFKED